MAAASALLMTGCDFSVYELPLPGGADVGENSYAVTVYFRDVLDLVPQSSVKVNDVTVGKVESVELRGFTAEVVVRVRGGVQLPDNAVAELRQTSLLGEKFVSLSPPASQPAYGHLSDGEVIPLERTGRNPEVEEVLGAMSLLLNGGGVAQLKTIAKELNNAFEGNEVEIKSVLGELDTFTGQLDANKEDIVAAIESLNRLAKTAREHKGSIVRATEQMPAALDSIDKQRGDLIRMLHALGRLSDVGTRVINASEANTISSLQSLSPILHELGKAGDSFPKAFQVLFTFPFVDAAVGNSPTEARNLHIGDYTNLAVKLELDLAKLLGGPPGGGGDGGGGGGQPSDLCELEPDLPVCDEGGGGGAPQLPDPGDVLDDPPLPGPGTGRPGRGSDGSGSGGGDGGGGDDCTLVVLCRTAPGFSVATAAADQSQPYDPDAAALLLQGVVAP